MTSSRSADLLKSPEGTARTMRRNWIPATVLALGLASIAMLVGTDWIREELLAHDTALGEALREVQTLEAISHLWLEEYVTGDELHLEEFWQAQARSKALIRAILDGGAFGTARVRRESLDDPEMRGGVEQIQRQLAAFQQIANKRYEGYLRGEEVGIGSPMDERYDAAFVLMLTSLQSLGAKVDERLAVAHRQSRILFLVILVTWSLLVVLAVIGLYTLERRRLAGEHALRESDAKLHRSQKMEAVGRLAGGMAHDINNYLAAMTAQCELVKLRPADGERNLRRMDTVMSSIDKAATLIRRLLAFSRREMVQPKVVSVNRAIGELGPMLSLLLGESIDLRIQLAERLPNVRIDPAQLEQAIVNLAVNAKEAMPVGGRLRVATSCRHVAAEDPPPRDLTPGPYVVLEIEDQGSGIPQELQEQIFEPFFTSKTAGESSGLGLATVYAIARQNNGAITVDSTVGVGSIFRLYLPSTESEAVEVPKPRDVPLEPGGESILVVEDNPELLESVQEALELLGYRVATATRGTDALKQFERDPHAIDLVVTDVVMPGMGGKQLVAAMHERRPDLPVIFVSGYTDDVMLRHGVSELEVHLIPKPFSIAVLLRKVQDVLRGTESRVA